MLKSSDIGYFRERIRDERQAAETARDPSAREAHLQLAERYSDRVWALEEQQRRVSAR